MIKQWLNRLQSSEAALQIVIALVVGLAGGAGVWFFKFLIQLVHQFLYNGMGSILASCGR